MQLFLLSQASLEDYIIIRFPVNLAEIATALNPTAKINSNDRRLQRFFADFELDYDLIIKLIVSLLPKRVEGYTLS